MNRDPHTLEIGLLAVIAISVALLAGWAISKGSAGESAAWSAILMAIVNSIKERWQSRTIDQMGRQLGASTPGDTATGKPGDPVHTVEENRL